MSTTRTGRTLGDISLPTNDSTERPARSASGGHRGTSPQRRQNAGTGKGQQRLPPPASSRGTSPAPAVSVAAPAAFAAPTAPPAFAAPPAASAALVASAAAPSASTALSIQYKEAFDRALDIIRKSCGDKKNASPLVMMLMFINKFHASKTGNPSPYATTLIEGFMWSIARGNPIELNDLTTRISTLSDKIGSDGFIDNLRIHLIGFISSPEAAEIIKPFVVENGMIGKKGARALKPITIEEFVDKKISDINLRSVGKYVDINKTLEPKVKSELISSIKKTADAKRATQPALSKFCEYLIANFDRIQLTDQNCNVIISSAFGYCSKIETVQNSDGKDYKKIFYGIPTSDFFGKLIKGEKWTVDGVERSFEERNGAIEVTIGGRLHLINKVFKKVAEGETTQATAQGAFFTIIDKIIDRKKLTEE